jgi:ankyrin repeat protein
MATSLFDFPIEILCIIFQYLDLKSKSKLSETCWLFYNIVNTPLSLMEQYFINTPLDTLIRSNNSKGIIYKLDNDPQIDIKSDTNGILCLAIEVCDIATIKLLIERGAKINNVIKFGDKFISPLIMACSFQRYEIAQYLLANDAEPRIHNNTPICIASEFGNIQMFDLLHSYIGFIPHFALLKAVEYDQFDLVWHMMTKYMYFTIYAYVNFIILGHNPNMLKQLLDRLPDDHFIMLYNDDNIIDTIDRLNNHNGNIYVKEKMMLIRLMIERRKNFPLNKTYSNLLNL